jgi:DNA-directed RNA polymerase beta subunit
MPSVKVQENVRNDEVRLNPNVTYETPEQPKLTTKELKTLTLFEEYLQDHNPLKGYIDVYNNWVNVQIEKRLKAEVIKINPNVQVEITRVIITKPTLNLSGRGNIPLYPIKCRDDGYSYMATIYIDISLFDNSRCVESINGIEFGKIPVMLKSILCHLNGLSVERLLKVGECPNDPGTMFIIKGSEKLIISQEKLKYNKPMVTFSTREDKKQEIVCKMTNSFPRGTSVIKLTTSNTNSIRVSPKFLQKGNTMSVLQIFRIYGIKEYEEMENIIMLFTKFDRKKLSLSLIATRNELLSIPNDVEYIEQKKGRFPNEMSYEDKFKIITQLVNNEFFPHMENEPPIKKLYLLSVMICRYLEYKSGYRDLDDRDDWGNKRVESPADNLKSLFNQVVKSVFDSINSTIATHNANEEPVNIETIRRVFVAKKRDVIDTFTDSFATNNWGLKSAKRNKRENITDNFLRESTLSSWYQTTKILANTSKQTKQYKARVIQMSQDNFIDIVDTPETDQCGLVKYLAITASVSIDRDEFTLRYYVNNDISNEYSKLKYYCLLNGKFMGWCNGIELEKKVRRLKSLKFLPKDTAVVLNRSEQSIELYTDGQRLVTPLLTVNQDTGELVLDELKAKYGEEFARKFDNIEREGAIEYLDPAEYTSMNIASSINEFKSYKLLYQEAQKNKEENYFAKLLQESDDELITYYGKRFIFADDIARTFEEFRTRFTHVKLDPNSVFGPISSSVILSDHTQGPRVHFTCKMTRQAAGIYHANHLFRYDASVKLAAWPSKPIFRNKTNALLGLENLPFGETVTLMFGSYTGYNQEDGIIMKKGAIERGLFTKLRMKSYKMIAESGPEFVEEFVRPEGNEEKYRHLDEFGIARVGSRVSANDVLIARKKTFTSVNEGRSFSFDVVNIGLNEEGVVYSVLKSVNSEGHSVIRVKVKTLKIPKVGDKEASRTAQKSTIGLILDDALMPHDKNGITPDIIINPHSIPSRMTVSKLYEMIATEYGARTGRYVDSTSFENFTIEDIKQYLRMKGMREYNDIEMYSGFTGEKMQCTIFVGLCYYMSLKHLVDEKIQARARGQVNPFTHQPVPGRKHSGGLRLGEMEKDAFVSHGASRIARERLFYSSDLWSTTICTVCNSFAISHQEDGKTYNVCNLCKEDAKFGICKVPPIFVKIIKTLNGVGINTKFKSEVTEQSDISEQFDKLEREIVSEEVDDNPGFKEVDVE